MLCLVVGTRAFDVSWLPILPWPRRQSRITAPHAGHLSPAVRVTSCGDAVHASISRQHQHCVVRSGRHPRKLSQQNINQQKELRCVQLVLHQSARCASEFLLMGKLLHKRKLIIGRIDSLRDRLCDDVQLLLRSVAIAGVSAMLRVVEYRVLGHVPWTACWAWHCRLPGVRYTCASNTRIVPAACRIVNANMSLCLRSLGEWRIWSAEALHHLALLPSWELHCLLFLEKIDASAKRARSVGMHMGPLHSCWIQIFIIIV